MNKLSRTKLARYVAAEVQAGRSETAIQQLAAYLVQTGRAREAELVIRAVNEELERASVVIASVTSAEPIDQAVREAVASMLGSSQIAFDETVDPGVLGGIRVVTPSRLLDATFRRRLTTLREHKV